MEKEWLKCALDECPEVFQKVVHNQRFHSQECTRIFTNRKILETYHQNKNKDLRGRVCSVGGCGTILSIYNPGTKCGVHEKNDLVSRFKNWELLVDNSDSET